MSTKKETFPDHSLNLKERSENSVIPSRNIAIPIDATKIILLDHILENILSGTEIETLLQWRLVSYRCNVFSKAQLRKRTAIKITRTASIVNGENVESLDFHNLPRSLSIRSLDNESVLNNLLLVMNVSSSFPVQNFTLSTTKLESPVFQLVLSAIRFEMKSLSLKLDYTQETCSFEESSLISCLKNILMDQTPNVESFSCCLEPPESGIWRYVNFDYDPYVQIFESSGKNNLNKMRFFSVIRYFPGIVFAEILKRATNLQSIRIGGFEVATDETLLGFFDETRQHQLKLIKHIKIFFHDRMISTYMHLFTLHASFIKLKSIYLQFFYKDVVNTDYQTRCSLVVNIILQSCSNTLKDMATFPLRFLSQLKIFPMPNLKKIIFHDWTPQDGVPPDDEYYYFFPKGFSMASKFCLEEIIVVLEDPAGMSMDFVRWLDIPEPINSVKRIWVLDPELVSDEVRDWTSKLFPNARYCNKQLLFSDDDLIT